MLVPDPASASAEVELAPVPPEVTKPRGQVKSLPAPVTGAGGALRFFFISLFSYRQRLNNANGSAPHGALQLADGNLAFFKLVPGLAWSRGV